MSLTRESSDILRKYLPLELQDSVLSNIEHLRDLAAFAETCKYWAKLIMPYHIEYRVLRINKKCTLQPTQPFDTPRNMPIGSSSEQCTSQPSEPSPLDVLFHLASSPTLARNIRVFNMHSTQPNIYPRSLTKLVNSSEHGDVSNELLWILYMQRALGSMTLLSTFTWDIRRNPSIVSEQLRQDSSAIFKALKSSTMLESLHVKIDEQINSMTKEKMNFQDFSSGNHALWQLSGLIYLTLKGPYEWLSCTGSNLSTMLQRSSSLQELSINYIPSIAIHFKSLRLPRLRKLTLCTVYRFGMSVDEEIHIIGFLSNHPSIEDLTWCPILDCEIQPGLLPNLMHIKSDAKFVCSLLQDHTTLNRKWETITRISAVDIETISALRRINRSGVKNLGVTVHCFGASEQLGRIARMFPNVTNLDVEEQTAFAISGDEWITALSRFHFLEYISSDLWNVIQRSSENERKSILSRLAAACPHLKKIGSRHSRFNEVIIRNRGRFCLER